jgi:hypothetical protein
MAFTGIINGVKGHGNMVFTLDAGNAVKGRTGHVDLGE